MLTGRQDVTDQVIALHPDLIVDYGATSSRYAQLIETVQAKTGIPAVLLDGALPQTPQVLRALGGALHREDRAGLLARQAEAILAAVPTLRARAPRVYYGRGVDGLVGSPGAGAGEVFGLLGWEVLNPQSSGTPSRTSIEAIQALDPDVVIFQNAGMRKVVADSAQWRTLRAVREHRAYVTPDVPFGWLDEPALDQPPARSCHAGSTGRRSHRTGGDVQRNRLRPRAFVPAIGWRSRESHAPYAIAGWPKILGS
jgi:iron complex transport system substrate-binding protein